MKTKHRRALIGSGGACHSSQVPDRPGSVQVPMPRRILRHRGWWLIGWALPNLAARHHLAERDRQVRNADLPAYGLPADVPAQRRMAGMDGMVEIGQTTFHAATLGLRHNRPDGTWLTITVCRRDSRQGGDDPLYRLAWQLMRFPGAVLDLDAAPRWAARTPEELREMQRQARTELPTQAAQILVDGTARPASLLRAGADWAGYVPIPEQAFDLELLAHEWPVEHLVISAVPDLAPYLAGSRADLGPLLMPRRPRLHRGFVPTATR